MNYKGGLLRGSLTVHVYPVTEISEYHQLSCHHFKLLHQTADRWEYKHLTGQSTRISQAVKDLRKCAISVLFLGLKVLARHIFWDSPSFPSDFYMVTAANCENSELRKKLPDMMTLLVTFEALD